MHDLSKGESVTIEIPARPRWAHTSVKLQEGATYDLRADGTWVDWFEKYRCGADGYESPSWFHRIAEGARAAPQMPWFSLVGAIDSDAENHFLIGSSHSYQPSRSGELTCFANDLNLMRWNNKGSVSLTVTQTS